MPKENLLYKNCAEKKIRKIFVEAKYLFIFRHPGRFQRTLLYIHTFADSKVKKTISKTIQQTPSYKMFYEFLIRNRIALTFESFVVKYSFYQTRYVAA